MTYTEALDLAAYAQQLFPMTTAPQAAVLREVLESFPDIEYAKATLKDQAKETSRLSVPAVREMLKGELRRRNETEEYKARQADRQQGMANLSEQQRVDQMIAELDDADLADLFEAAVMKVAPDLWDFVKRHDPRKAPMSRNLIYRFYKHAQTAGAR